MNSKEQQLMALYLFIVHYQLSIAVHCRSLLLKGDFVGGRAVDGGDGDVVEPEIDAELGAVVDDVAEDETAQHHASGHGHNRHAAL